MMPDLTVLLCGLLVYAGCAVLGAAAVPGGGRLRAADPLVGLGLASAIVTVAAVLRLPPALALAGCAVLAAAALVWHALRRRAVGGTALLAAAILALPLMALAAATSPLLWDDFMHWLVNAGYVWRHGGLPWPDAEPSFSIWPAYPYTVPFWIVAVSEIAGRFVENAAGLLNLLLLATGAALLVAVVEGVRGPLTRLGRLALAGPALGAMLILTPEWEIVFSAYADIATAVATMACGVIGWTMLERHRAGGDVRALAWQLGWCAAALVNLKQPNILLLALLLGGGGLMALREGGWPGLLPWLRRLPALLGPAALVFLVWRHYVGGAAPGGEFTVPPTEMWHFDMAPQVAAAMWRTTLADPFPIVTLFAAALWGLVALRRRVPAPGDRLAVLVGTGWAGYYAFLWFVYLAVFSPFEAERAAQFDRYSSHLALLAGAAMAAAIAQRWPAGGRRWLPAGLAAGIAVLLLPLLAPAAVRPASSPATALFDAMGRDLAETLPRGARLLAVDPGGHRLFTFVLRYRLWRIAADDRDLRVVASADLLAGDKADSIVAGAFADPAVTHVAAAHLPPNEAALLGVAPAPDSAVLLARGDGGWEIVRRWQRPPEAK
ncbi:MAG TPA: hypothetical protein VEH84_05105 [Alphaproteobacteria bacterium]|nr:hypothetical protein [Alphaproteobacteria bacterium]